MGGFLSKKPCEMETMAALEELTKKIEDLEERKKYNVESQKRTVTTFVVRSVLAYLVVATVWYFCFFPDDWVSKVIYSTPLLVFPLVIYLVKRILHWYFVKRITENELQLESLNEKRKKILDDVMEKETYKKAREILTRFGPERMKEDRSEVEEEILLADNAKGETSTVRKRKSSIASTGTHSSSSADSAFSSPVRPPQQAMVVRPVPVRPILKQDRNVMDKLVDFLLGDGPNHRYALICRECSSHNGMALQEEFEYLSFRCIYCCTVNPSRKQKPLAPKLEASPAKIFQAPKRTEVATPESREDLRAGAKPTEDPQKE